MTATKIEIVNWILSLNNDSAIEEVMALMKTKLQTKTNASTATIKKRQFGCGKQVFSFVAADFNEPLPEFAEYTL